MNNNQKCIKSENVVVLLDNLKVIFFLFLYKIHYESNLQHIFLIL